MSGVIEFLSSLELFGWIILALVVLVILNLKNTIFLRSPLDSQQHRGWGNSGGETKADHLEQKSDEY